MKELVKSFLASPLEKGIFAASGRRDPPDLLGPIVRHIKGNVRFIAVKEGIWLDEERNSQTQAMARMFGLLAETDRELVSIHKENA